MDELEFLEKLGKKLKKARLAKGLTQLKVGVMCGVEKTYISKIERGKSNVTILSLRKIGLALGINIKELL